MSHVIRDEARKIVEEKNRGREEGEKFKLSEYEEEKLDEIEHEIENFKEKSAEDQAKEKESFVRNLRDKAKDALGTKIFDYDEFYSSSGFLSKVFHKLGLI